MTGENVCFVPVPVLFSCPRTTMDSRPARVELLSDVGLRFHFPNSDDYADYHFIWLRHNCDNIPACRHPKTGERTIDSTDFPSSIRPKRVSVLDDVDGQPGLEVVWEPVNGATEGHVSRYSSAFLRQYAYALNRAAVPVPESDLSLVEIDYVELGKQGDANALMNAACSERLKKYGIVVVRNRGLDTEEIIDSFLPTGSTVISSHFGRVEDLRTDNTTNKNTDQLGYTNAPVGPHTDQPFIANPPGMQMLHCITPADVGGDNYVIDARQAALYLKSIDRRAYELLTTVPVKFHRKQKEFESIIVSPIIEVGKDTGEIKRFRHSYFTFAPYDVPFDMMEEWYRAMNRFTSIVRDERYQYKFKLDAGDFLMYDNFRMLHARHGFSGARHVRGVYFDHVDVWKKIGQ